VIFLCRTFVELWRSQTIINTPNTPKNHNRTLESLILIKNRENFVEFQIPNTSKIHNRTLESQIDIQERQRQREERLTRTLSWDEFSASVKAAHSI
jgi:hypothetical protein